jgi:hypothetical protein
MLVTYLCRHKSDIQARNQGTTVYKYSTTTHRIDWNEELIYYAAHGIQKCALKQTNMLYG